MEASSNMRTPCVVSELNYQKKGDLSVNKLKLFKKIMEDCSRVDVQFTDVIHV